MKELLEHLNSGPKTYPYYLTYEYQGKWGEHIGYHTSEERDLKKVEEEIRNLKSNKNGKVLSLEIDAPRECVYAEKGIRIWRFPKERYYRSSVLRDQPPYLAVEISNYYGEKFYDKLTQDFVEAILKLYLDKKFPFQLQQSETPSAVPPDK